MTNNPKTQADIDLAQNPGFEPYDMSEFKGVKGQNFFDSDSVLVRLMKRSLPDSLKEDAMNHMSGFGKISSLELDDQIFAAHKEGKYGFLEKYDRAGNRIDEINYCEEQKAARKIAYDYGIVNLDFHREWPHEFHYLHRMGLAYLQNQNGEGGVACPLAMTEGLINILKELGTEEQKRKFLPILTDPEKGTHFMAGQYVTERVGGSNVSANRTVAYKKPDGKYILHGEKWFCSNPGDLWVTTARIEGTSLIGLFLMPRYKDNGELNEHHILRTKDIIGSRGKVTAEVEYRGAEAEVIGKPSRGLAYLLEYVLKISRIHVALGGLGMARRAYIEALAYAKRREAYGKKVSDFPMVAKNLATMKTKQVAATLSVFQSWQYILNKNKIEDILVPALKYTISTLGSHMAREAILVLGGNGIIGDFSILPRLMNDNIINETWEGTHNILGEHTIKALKRPKLQEAFFDEMESFEKNADKFPELKDELLYFQSKKDQLKEYARNLNTMDIKLYQMNILPLVDFLYEAFSTGLLLREAIIDLQEGQKTYHHFLRAYIEIQNRKSDQMVTDGQIFHDLSILEMLIDY